MKPKSRQELCMRYFLFREPDRGVHGCQLPEQSEMERSDKTLEKERYETECRKALTQRHVDQSMKELQTWQQCCGHGGEKAVKPERADRSPSVPGGRNISDFEVGQPFVRS